MLLFVIMVDCVIAGFGRLRYYWFTLCLLVCFWVLVGFMFYGLACFCVVGLIAVNLLWCLAWYWWCV